MNFQRCAVALASPLVLRAQNPASTGGDFWAIKIGDVIMIVAVLLAPLAALQVQRWLQTRREIRDRKLFVFRTLWATRRNILSIEHVVALNMIDLEFYGNGTKDKEVVRAWNVYRDHLSTPSGGDQLSHAQLMWREKRELMFTTLLLKLGAVVDYDFDEVLLKKGAYFPEWQGDLEDDQLNLRKGLLRMLSGEKPLKMEVASFPPTISEEEAKEQQRIRELLIAYLDGQKPVPIRVVQAPAESRNN